MFLDVRESQMCFIIPPRSPVCQECFGRLPSPHVQDFDILVDLEHFIVQDQTANVPLLG